MTTAPPSGLPAYADYVSHIERGPRIVATRWPFAVFAVIGALLVAAPLVTGMFPRAVEGEAMIDAFAPFVSATSIENYRADLRVLDEARTNVLAVRANDQQPGSFDRIDQFVRDYPAIRADMSAKIDAIDADRGNYEKLSATTSFGALPWLLALPGLLLVAAGVLGVRVAREGRRGTLWRALAVLAALGLLAVPLTGGLFRAAPAAQPLIDGFRPILTHQEVRKAQGYFVTLVAAQGEFDSRYAGAVRTAHPDADLSGITALQARWQPMTARFAALIGTMNDNIANFDAVVALNDSTKPLGFTAFRGIALGYLIPGALVLAVSVAASRSPRQRSGGAPR